MNELMYVVTRSPPFAWEHNEKRTQMPTEKELLERIRHLEEQNSALQDKLDMIYAILAPDYEEPFPHEKARERPAVWFRSRALRVPGPNDGRRLPLLRFSPQPPCSQPDQRNRRHGNYHAPIESLRNPCPLRS